MRYYYKPALKNTARDLRKNMTKAEVRLWQRIRKKQINNVMDRIIEEVI